VYELKKLTNMSLEEKVGQLFLVAVNGPGVSEKYKQHFLKHKLGNFICFAYDLKDYAFIRNLTDELQAITKESCGIPAFISVDQEGGMVTRVFSGATHFSSNMAVTASQMNSSVETMGHMVGKELRALGLNLNHAPSLDVNNNAENPIIGIRSYSDDPNVVARMGVDYIKGLQKGGVMANAKHFPGHGDTSMDSHHELPTIPHGLDRLNELELIPFKEAIKNGVDSIMTAHIIFKLIDPKYPATLSEKIITGFLREELGFEGIVVSDCMTMNAIKEGYTTAQGCVIALNAGIDLLCLNATEELQTECYNKVLNAVKSGELPLAKVDKAVARILKHKEKYNLTTPAPAPLEIYPEHEKLADEISKKAITLVYDNKNLLPIKDKKIMAISPMPVRTAITDDADSSLQSFAKQASTEFNCPFKETGINPDTEEIQEILEAAKDFNIILLASYHALTNPGQTSLFNALKSADKQVILVTLHLPYDMLKMPNADASVAAYEYTGRAVKNALYALAGKQAFLGKMPVSNC